MVISKRVGRGGGGGGRGEREREGGGGREGLMEGDSNSE